jgi:rhamnogalacturonan acetylesterase
MQFNLKILACVVVISISLAFDYAKRKPVIYLIGDSTVKNGGGRGEGGLWGWGDFLHEFTDTTKISIRNHARGGRSSRTYQAEALWDEVLQKLQKGDIVIMQFGHNDASPVNDTLRARGTLPGTGEEVQEIDNLITKKHEVVHTYGWYLRRFIQDTNAKGATAIVFSPVARNNFKEGKVSRTTDTYTAWAKAVAKAQSVLFIDLNDLTAQEYERIGESDVTSTLFLTDHTHTNEKGARINASIVRDALVAADRKGVGRFFK